MVKRIQHILVFLSLLIVTAAGQSTGDFRSAASGSWGTNTNWETFDGTIWNTAVAAPTSADGNITILNTHSITVDAAVSADQLVIDAGGTLTVSSGQTLTIANGTGTDITVNGTLVRTGTLTLTGTMTVGNGGVYQHNATSGLPTATWNSGSTCLVTGVVAGTSLAGTSQAFHHFTWNCTGQTATCQLGMASGTTIGGNFTVQSTNSGKVRFVSLAASDNKTININGDLIINGGTLEATGSGVVATVNVNVLGNFTLAGGSYFVVASSATGILNVSGNMSISSGTLSKGSGAGTVNFNKSGVQTFTKTGGTIAGSGSNLTFVVNNGSTLDMGTNILDGTGIFTLSSGGGLKLKSAGGIAATGATGNIQISGARTFNTGANYEYNGTIAQITGAGLPATVNNLTIDNNAGVTNSQPVTVNGVLTLQNGIFDNSINAVTLGGGGSTVTVLGSLVTPLPVELTSFATSVKGNTVQLHWSTATEVNNSGFDVEKNVNGAWKKLGFVEGAGTSNTVHQYSYADNAVTGSTVSYRLKQIDRDGKFTYSNTVEAVTALSANDYVLSQNYPNPFNPSTTFSFAMKNAERTTVKVYNLIGQEVAVLFNDVAQPTQLYTLRFDAKDLPSGIYLYSLRSATRNEVKKMLLMK